MSEEIPDPLAGLDQMLRAMVDVAKAARIYYTALVDEGFTEPQALELTSAWQTQVLRGAQDS